ncbi:MAG: hypothetical protein LC107_06510 [Chitinophagales bacterium]|nr:hypothetical protein [Chitinophagales bacterium]
MENKDLLKRIKGLFIVTESGAAGDTTQKTEVSSTVEQVKKPSGQPVFTSEAQDSTGYNEKHIQILMHALEQNNIEGFDYLEYKNSLLSISNVIADETMRYKSAFEMAKTMGLDKRKLLDSAEYYMNILVGEQKKFMEALENQKGKQIQARVDSIEKLEKSVVDKKKMIENLNKELETMNTQMGELKKEISEEVQKIELTNKQFMASYHYVTGQIQSDIEKINKNI